MKYKRVVYIALFFLVSTQVFFAQQASGYFPSQAGYVWKYLQTPLDSLNNPVDSLSYFQIDSFAVTANYNGMLADVVLSKSGTEGIINYLPYSDSLFYHFNLDTAYEYARIGQFAGLILTLDSLFADSNFSFFNFLKSLEDWYPVYRFASPVGNEYTVYSVDTAINFGTTTLPLRFEFLAKRLQDETINTLLGTFNCKKFFIERGVSIVFFLLPPIEIAYIGDTLWIAPDNWVVKSFVPSTSIDLQFFGGPAFYIPGLSTEILDEPTNVQTGFDEPESFQLAQNYPNPFNPETNINFYLNESGFVNLKVYNLLGEEIKTLVSKEMNPGNYELQFNGTGLPSGIYFYKLEINYNQPGKPGFAETKKMLLLK